MFRLPAVASGRNNSVPADTHEKQMGVGVAAVAMSAATPWGMRVLRAVIVVNRLLQRHLGSHHRLMPIRREHEVRDRDKH